MSDPIKLPEIHVDSSYRGGVFIPFEGSNPRVVNGKGTADFTLAIDLPPFQSQEAVRVYVIGNPLLSGRIIEYREYSYEEIEKIPELTNYLRLHKHGN